MQYNQMVNKAFAQPKYVFAQEQDHVQGQGSAWRSAKGGARESGAKFSLYLNVEESLLKYRVYGNPYAIAAAEFLCQKFNAGQLSLGENLDTEAIKEQLEMPYAYFYILLALEDAWLGLSKVT